MGATFVVLGKWGSYHNGEQLTNAWAPVILTICPGQITSFVSGPVGRSAISNHDGLRAE